MVIHDPVLLICDGMCDRESTGEVDERMNMPGNGLVCLGTAEVAAAVGR